MNATRQEEDACMHDFGFSKQNIYHFQKKLIFLIFQKFENPGMLHTTTLKRNLVPRFEEARKIGFENSGFFTTGWASTLKRKKKLGSLECQTSNWMLD